MKQVGEEHQRLSRDRGLEQETADVSGQADRKGDAEDPVGNTLPGSCPTDQRQVLAHPLEQRVAFQLPKINRALALTALISGRARSLCRSRFSGHG